MHQPSQWRVFGVYNARHVCPCNATMRTIPPAASCTSMCELVRHQPEASIREVQFCRLQWLPLLRGRQMITRIREAISLQRLKAHVGRWLCLGPRRGA